MNAEFFAEVISGSWSRAETERDWFQIRSWCHGAAIFADRSEDRSDILILQRIATQHQHQQEAA